MSQQLSHKNTPITFKKFPIKLICDGVKSPSNIGALFRICDAMGVSEIIFCNTELNINSPRLQKTARSTQKKVSYSVSESILQTISELKKEKHTIIALEITDKSILIEDLIISENQKIAIIIGNEQNGISGKVLKTCDVCTQIAMFGENSSINVSQAASIALHLIITKLQSY